MYILQETSQRLRAYRSFSPYWKVTLIAKDKWPLKTLIIKNTELSGPLSASAMREHLIFMSSKVVWFVVNEYHHILKAYFPEKALKSYFSNASRSRYCHKKKQSRRGTPFNVGFTP